MVQEKEEEIKKKEKAKEEAIEMHGKRLMEEAMRETPLKTAK